MQKIYVLLRHDKQTGPYSLQEIIQFDLKPYDLIWIEGQSAGWYYPQEIAALHPYLRFLPKKPAAVNPVPPLEKRVAVQMPVISETPLVSPLEEIADTTPTETYQPFALASENLEEAVYAQFRKPAAEKELADAATSLPKKKGSPNPVFVGITTVLIVGGVFAASWFMNRHSTENKATTETVTETPVPNAITPPAVAANDNTKGEQIVFAARQKRTKNSSLPTQTTTAVKSATKQIRDEKTRPGYPADEATGYGMTGTTTPGEEVQQKAPSTTAHETTTAPQEEKKSLKDKFLDLFKKKPDESKEEERRSTGTENGERVSTRRESSANLAQMVHVRFDVPNDWMMGIKGAKATLVNRSSEKIKSATVEVLYYNDDNELLQKKVVTFGKIDAKESGTITIPDHSTATKVDYQVLSVTGASQLPA